MNRLWKTSILLSAASTLFAAARLAYPPARVEPIAETHFGVTLPDPYRWLEQAASPDVQSWIRAEDQLSKAWLAKLPLRQTLLKRLRELYDVDQTSLPQIAGAHVFYTRRQVHQEKAVVYEFNQLTHQETALLDPNPRGGSSENLSLGELYPSPDGMQLAYTEKPHNADEAVLHVMAVTTRQEISAEKIPGANVADLSWAPDSRGFYYTRLPVDPSIPASEREAYADIRYHALGTAPQSDPQIYPRTGDASVYYTPQVSRDGRWLFISVIRGWASNDIYLRDLHAPGSAFQPLFISTCATASVVAWQGRFYLTTNENAPHQKVLVINPEHRDRRLWRSLVPERQETMIEATQILGNHLVLRLLKDVSSQIEIRSLEGRLERTVPLPEIGTVSDIHGHEEEDMAYFEFESFFVPPRIYRCSIASGTISLWSETHVPINSTPYSVERVVFHSKDGTPVSMFVVSRKHLPRDQSTPFQILGYGGFQESLLPRFNAAIYPWLEAGGGVAIPHLRGGGEYGENWHRAGMRLQKQHTFDDMIAAAEYLIQKGYTRESLLAMQGASNGGLLVGAVLTQRPDLFRAVVCKNPLLDMIRYPLYGEGKTWIPEYGSPDEENDFRALAAYSPYHRVKKSVSYPAVLMLSAENDDRVDPMHARKMTAALQAATTSNRPILFHVLTQSGHSGADRVEAQAEEGADRLSFLLEELGLDAGN